METPDRFEGLRFDRRLPGSLPRRLITYAAGWGVFTLLWLLVPAGVLYWLLLPLLAALLWVASYGWRQALAALIKALERLEQM